MIQMLNNLDLKSLRLSMWSNFAANAVLLAYCLYLLIYNMCSTRMMSVCLKMEH